MILATARPTSRPAAMRCKPTLPHIDLQIPQAWLARRRAEHQAMTGKFVIVPGDQVIGKAGGDALPEIGMIQQPMLNRAKWRNRAWLRFVATSQAKAPILPGNDVCGLVDLTLTQKEWLQRSIRP